MPTLNIPSKEYVDNELIKKSDVGHNHTSLIDITQLNFKCHANDTAYIGTTIEDTNTYFDFYLADDANQNDSWRWVFYPSGGTAFNAMVLDATSGTAATLTVNGTINATTFNGNATSATKATQDGNGKVIASTYLPLSAGANSIITGFLTFKPSVVHPAPEGTVFPVDNNAGLYWSGSSDNMSIYYRSVEADHGALIFHAMDDDNVDVIFEGPKAYQQEII
jgi:hypothetical protein